MSSDGGGAQWYKGLSDFGSGIAAGMKTKQESDDKIASAKLKRDQELKDESNKIDLDLSKKNVLGLVDKNVIQSFNGDITKEIDYKETLLNKSYAGDALQVSVESQEKLETYMATHNGTLPPGYNAERALQAVNANIKGYASAEEKLKAYVENVSVGDKIITEAGKIGFTKSPKQLEIEAGEAKKKGLEKAREESFTRASGFGRAVKKLDSITRQFNEALPNDAEGITTGARISGIVSMLGAITGVKSNPKLLALRNTAKLTLRSILRDMGEGARLSDQDISQNIAVIEQAGLSNEERLAQVGTFIQTAVDSMDQETLEIFANDKGFNDILREMDISTPMSRERTARIAELRAKRDKGGK